MTVRKIISAAVIVFCLTAAACADYTEGTLYYTIADESVTVTGCFGRDAVVEIPAAIAGYPVNTIGVGAFADNADVETLILPDCITCIEPGAIREGIRLLDADGAEIEQETKMPDTPSAPDEAAEPAAAAPDEAELQFDEETEAAASASATDTGSETTAGIPSDAAAEAVPETTAAASREIPAAHTRRSIALPCIIGLAIVTFIGWMRFRRKKA